MWEPEHVELFFPSPEHRPPPARPSTGFLKPSSDDEDSGPQRSSIPAWKKSSSPTRRGLEKPQQEEERSSGKAVSAPQHGDKAAVTTSRFLSFLFVLPCRCLCEYSSCICFWMNPSHCSSIYFLPT